MTKTKEESQFGEAIGPEFQCFSSEIAASQRQLKSKWLSQEEWRHDKSHNKNSATEKSPKDERKTNNKMPYCQMEQPTAGVGG